MVKQYKNKLLNIVNGKCDGLTLCEIIGFRKPLETIKRYVPADEIEVDENNCIWLTENGVWSLVYAPTVKENTKHEIAEWLRNEVFIDKPANIQEFVNPRFGEIYVLDIEGEPWFIGKNVATALGYSNYRDAIIKHIDESDRSVAKHDTTGGIRNVVIINESGLYSLILSSKLPNVKPFKQWVTKEVLPSIRKNGKYEVEQQASAIQMIMQRFDKLEQKLLSDKPKVDFYDKMMASDGSVRLDVLANVLAKNGVTKQNGTPIGRDSLFARLRNENYLTNKKALDGYGNKRYENRPTQRAIERGLFERVASHNHGILSYTVYVTPKGIDYFCDKFIIK